MAILWHFPLGQFFALPLSWILSTKSINTSLVSPVPSVTCMTSLPVGTLLSKLEHWLSILASFQSSLQTQVSQLGLALSNLHIHQPSPLVIQNIHSVREAIAYRLSEVLQEISDLELAKNLLTTPQSSTQDNYKYIFQLLDRHNNLTHRAVYYQELSELFESIYHYCTSPSIL